MLKAKQQRRCDECPRHSLRTIRRASRRLRDNPRRCREDAAELFRDDLVRPLSGRVAISAIKGRATDEQLRKYQFMEQSTQKRALGLKDKIPDIQKTLETVQFLKSRDVRLSLTLPARHPN